MVEQEFSGDYGYDLADEVRSMVAGTTDRVRRTPMRGIRAATGIPDAGGDFGYDLAHES